MSCVGGGRVDLADGIRLQIGEQLAREGGTRGRNDEHDGHQPGEGEQKEGSRDGAAGTGE